MTLYDQMMSIAYALDQMPRPEIAAEVPRSQDNTPDDESRPGSIYNARAVWADVLAPHGWTPLYECGGLTAWRRPGKTTGQSATTGIRSDCGKDLLYVFTTNAAPLDPTRSYSKFAAYAVLNHGGNFSTAAKTLRAEGYCRSDAFPDVNLNISQPSPSTNGHTDKPSDPPETAPSGSFPPPIPASRLMLAGGPAWLWHGYLARGGVTLFSALWKSGKTTLLAHLLKALEKGGTFCGLALHPGRVLYITEESEHRWAERRDQLKLTDHLEFLVRPFGAKPDWSRWNAFLDYLKALQDTKPADLIVFDTLSNLWPVKDENDAPQVQAALMPLHRITEKAALALVHHNRKGDGTEATAARGSGALAAFVDTIMEFRRYDPKQRQNRQRVLTGYGRYEETPGELVVELTENGYVAQGDRRDTRRHELEEVIVGMLPARPGLTVKEIEDQWPDTTSPRHQDLIDALNDGAEHGLWFRSGAGKKGDPHRYGAI